ncbi:MAG: hypothetical protein E4H11_05180 [Myxococcales bacterium]|nr:MAG: hypothetical protein E4H11_05180 [Myxococcales bacterium]
MRFVIYGAGAVGGVIGARLHEHGHDVALIARGEHLDALVSRGLELVTPTSRSRHEIPAYGHPSEVGLGATDVVLLTTKTQHTLAARPTPDILRWKYHKLLGNLRNALIATLGPGVDAEDLPARLRAEAIAVYEAAGIDWVPEDVEALRRKGADMKVSMIEGEPPLMGSSWQSLTRGGSIESDYLNGEIVLLGRLHGVATPVNRALQVAANRLAREGGKPGDLSLAELRSLVDELDSAGRA